MNWLWFLAGLAVGVVSTVMTVRWVIADTKCCYCGLPISELGERS